MNLLAATIDNPSTSDQLYNVAVAERTTLNALFELERALLVEHFPRVRGCRPRCREFREGDALFPGRHLQSPEAPGPRRINHSMTGLSDFPGHGLRSSATAPAAH